jgi:hypothetical protein
MFTTEDVASAQSAAIRKSAVRLCCNASAAGSGLDMFSRLLIRRASKLRVENRLEHADSRPSCSERHHQLRHERSGRKPLGRPR